MKIIRIVFTALFINYLPLMALTDSTFVGPDKDFAFTVSFVCNPKAPLGFNLAAFRDGGFGFFIEGKMGGHVNKEDDYSEVINYKAASRTYGDKTVDSKDRYIVFNGGVTRLISDKVGIYCGIGVSVHTMLYKFFDSTYILGDDGHYWVEDTGNRDYNINFNGGVQFVIAKMIHLVAGVDSNPAMGVLGIGMYL